MNELKIRRADIQDLDGSYVVIQECKDLLARQGMDNWARYTKEKVEDLIHSDSMFILIKENEVIGTIRISELAPVFYNAQDMAHWEDPRANAFYFTTLAVSPKYQGKGYGSILLDYLEQYAKEHKVSYLRMTMFSENVALANYYIRRGFTFPQKRKIEELELTLSFGEKKITAQ